VSARTQRPQMVPERGLRVALLAQRNMSDPMLLSATAELQRIGWTLAAVVEPERFRDALRMLLAGMADRVVVLRPEEFPVLAAADLAAYGTVPAVNAGRTRLLPRPGSEAAAASLRQRRPEPLLRPQFVDGPATAVPESEFRHAAADSATTRPNSGAEIPGQAPARPTNAGSEFGTPVPNPAGRRRASERHGRTTTADRRRRRT